MSKKSISSLELTALVNELKFIINGKISQIYHPESKMLLLQLHVPGKGKKLLKVASGRWLCLTVQKENGSKPSGFCMQLRKYINNAIIKDFYQQESERIVIFELEKIEKYFLIIELFSKGNVILTDAKKTIIAALDLQKWKDRIVKPKEEYLFPPLDINWKELNLKELQKILKASQKRNLATSLATEIGLGGLYAEELCRQAGVDLKISPPEVTAKEAESLIKELDAFQESIIKPKGYIYEVEIAPFPLLGKNMIKETDTYNEAIDSLNILQKPSPYENKINTLKHTLGEQEEAIKNLKEKIDVAAKKGELMYEKYAALQKLREIVENLKRNKSWKEIAEELKKEKKIKTIDLEKKIIVLDI